MKTLSLLLIFALISLSSSNDIEDKIKCIIENENIRKNVMDIINSIIAKEDLKTIISKIISAYYSVKDDVKKCLIDNEPVLKGGCRYEEQFIYCRKHSCEYMDDYTCMEYCYRKYC